MVRMTILLAALALIAAASHALLQAPLAVGANAASGPPEIIRGVNLGGWLVLEPWITPSLFDVFLNTSSDVPVDEWTYTAILGPEEASKRLHKHWDSWVTQNDLATLAKAGITHVRVPVGYWALSVEPWEPFVQGQWPYLLRVLGWCKDLGIKVLIDLHGAPGSQNGFDNSGRRGDILWNEPSNTNYFRTLSVMANLTAMLEPYSAANGGAVTAVELVNEPFVSVPLDFIKQYYLAGYPLVKAAGNMDVVIHDAFRLQSWANFMGPPDFQNVYLDTHVYHVFDQGLLHLSSAGHLNYTCDAVASQEASAAQNLWLITGEWSLATTDCAHWLNGMLKGSRWDGTLDPSQPAIGECAGNAGNDLKNFTQEYLDFLRQFAEVQMDVFESASDNSAGWYFWNFKTEASPQWDFLLGLATGYIPNPVTSRSYSCATRGDEPTPSEDLMHQGASSQPQREATLQQEGDDGGLVSLA